MADSNNKTISITPVLQHLADSTASVQEIVAAVALIFQNQLSPVQCGSLLSLLRATGRDQDAAVVAQCAAQMRQAGSQVNYELIHEVVNKRKSEKSEGSYSGGLCTIEGTGGDGHSTFNVSTAAAIVASAVVLIAKHGAGASSSKSGAADILRAIQPVPPVLESVTPATLPKWYEEGNFSFLFAPVFHPGVKNVISIRKELGFKTIFNILGPLAHPLNPIMEARVIGVSQRHLGPIYAEAMRMSGVRKTLIVCGAESLDEISCAGPTFCWRLHEEKSHTTPVRGNDAFPFAGIRIEEFQLHPSDFGLPVHPLSDVPHGKFPIENAEILKQMLLCQLQKDDPSLQFVLMNTAALFVIAGICDDDDNSRDILGGPRNSKNIIKEVGPGGGRWKEGMRRARLAVESGLALKSLEQFIEATRKGSL